MVLLVLGLVLFFGPHIIRMVAPVLRERGIAKMGPNGWRGTYALVSLIGFILIVIGFGQFRLDTPEVYQPPSWGLHATSLLVLVALILIASAYLPVGRIRAVLGHPFLIGIILWSLGHLLANGDLASVLLFGSFLVYGVWNRVSVAGRGQSAPAFVTYKGDVAAVVIGSLAFGVIAYWLHLMVLGVSPLP